MLTKDVTRRLHFHQARLAGEDIDGLHADAGEGPLGFPRPSFLRLCSKYRRPDNISLDFDVYGKQVVGQKETKSEHKLSNSDARHFIHLVKSMDGGEPIKTRFVLVQDVVHAARHGISAHQIPKRANIGQSTTSANLKENGNGKNIKK